jgi:hypothetical protein
MCRVEVVLEARPRTPMYVAMPVQAPKCKEIKSAPFWHFKVYALRSGFPARATQVRYSVAELGLP